MKMTKFFAIMLVLTGAVSQGNFWDDWTRPQTQDQLEKRNIDLKYQEKQARVANEAQKKQEDLRYKQSKLELDRKRDQLRLDR